MTAAGPTPTDSPDWKRVPPDPGAYDFWVCDLDGTLVDIDPGYARSVIRRVGNRLGERFDDGEAEVLWYGVGESRDRLLAERGIDPRRFWEVFHEEDDPGERVEATHLYDDATAVRDLSAPVALVTHCPADLTGLVLDRLGVEPWFDAVIACDETTGWKPNPEPVKRAMRDLGVAGNGHAGALVGDDPYDVGAARNAGLDAVHVERRDPVERSRCVVGDYRVPTLDPLVEG